MELEKSASQLTCSADCSSRAQSSRAGSRDAKASDGPASAEPPCAADTHTRHTQLRPGTPLSAAEPRRASQRMFRRTLLHKQRKATSCLARHAPSARPGALPPQPCRPRSAPPPGLSRRWQPQPTPPPPRRLLSRRPRRPRPRPRWRASQPPARAPPSFCAVAEKTKKPCGVHQRPRHRPILPLLSFERLPTKRRQPAPASPLVQSRQHGLQLLWQRLLGAAALAVAGEAVALPQCRLPDLPGGASAPARAVAAASMALSLS
jgi:hypothetical protein